MKRPSDNRHTPRKGTRFFTILAPWPCIWENHATTIAIWRNGLVDKSDLGPTHFSFHHKQMRHFSRCFHFIFCPTCIFTYRCENTQRWCGGSSISKRTLEPASVCQSPGTPWNPSKYPECFSGETWICVWCMNITVKRGDYANLCVWIKRRLKPWQTGNHGVDDRDINVYGCGMGKDSSIRRCITIKPLPVTTI